MTSEIIGLFPTPVFRTNIGVKQEWIDFIKTVEFENLASNNGCVTKEKYILDLQELSELKHLILQSLDEYIHKLLCVDFELDFYLTNSWAVRHDTSHYADQHYHANSLLSGVFYLEVPEGDSGDFIAHSDKPSTVFPQQIEPTYKEWNIFNSNRWKIPPTTGDVLIFPSDMKHSVSENRTNNQRYVIAFNVFVRGEFGVGYANNLSRLIVL